MFLQYSLGKLGWSTYDEGLPVRQPMHGLLHFFIVQNGHDTAGKMASACSFRFVVHVVCFVEVRHFICKEEERLLASL